MTSRVRALWLVLVVTLVSAAPALAMIEPRAVDGAVGPATPEPTAALLFAAGAGLVHWSLRRRARR